MKLRDTFRVTASNNPTVRDIAPAINGNQEALAELQTYVSRLEARVIALEERVAKDFRSELSDNYRAALGS